MLTSPCTLPQGTRLCHVPVISLAQCPARRRHFPVDTEPLSPPFPTPHIPAPKHQPDHTAAVPSPPHADGNVPVTQRRAALLLITDIHRDRSAGGDAQTPW